MDVTCESFKAAATTDGGVSFRSPRDGWALAAGGTWRTSDAMHWSRVSAPTIFDVGAGPSDPTLQRFLEAAGVPAAGASRGARMPPGSSLVVGVDTVVFPSGSQRPSRRLLEQTLGQLGDGPVETVDVAGEPMLSFRDVDGRARLLWIEDQFATVFGELRFSEGADLAGAAAADVTAVHALGIGL